VIIEAAVATARDWLYPAGAVPRFEALLRCHRAADRETISRQATQRGGLWLALDQCLDARPDLLLELVGCAGLHFLDSATEANVSALSRAVSGNIAELCSLARVPAEWSLHLRADDALTFPLSALSVTAKNDGDARIAITDGGTVEVRIDDDFLSIAPARGAGPLTAETQRTASMELARSTPFLHRGIRLAQGGLPALLQPPPGFSYLKEAPTEPDLGLLASCFDLLARYRPELLDEMRALPTWVVLLERGDHRLSFTADELPGVLYTNLVDPLETLDLIVHEYHHLKLDLLETQQPLLRKPTTPAVAPWRPDIRSARGVLHGAYVFMNVAHVFEPLFDAGTPSRQGRRRRVVWREAVASACQDLTEVDCGLTTFGRSLVRAMHDDALDWLAGAEEYADEREWAREHVARHAAAVRAGLMPEPTYMTGIDANTG
jgi:HEXXH motif-containing protein